MVGIPYLVCESTIVHCTSHMPELSLSIPSSISSQQQVLSGTLHISAVAQYRISQIRISFKKVVQLVDKKGELENYAHELGRMQWNGKMPISPEQPFEWAFGLPIFILSPQNVPLKEEGRLGKILQRLETKMTAEYPSHQLLVEVMLGDEKVIRHTEAVQVRY